MADRSQGRGRKRTHFEMERSRKSPFQNPARTGESAAVVSKAPRGINSAEFAESRALEIHNMLQALSSASKQSNKRVFQSLPRHMRRRAASHNSKRVPVRLRGAYDREAVKSLEKSKEPSKQTKSRRHRRKHSNLLQEYNRRKRKHAWLETHIWHAKRFKMIEQWGYKIPWHPNDKSVRASYRAMANGCLLQDISYYQCIEVKGRQEVIIAAMKHLISSDIGLTVVGRDYLDGKYEGEMMLYKYERYPYQPIAPVMFLWQQQVNAATDMMRKLWIWSHPSCSDEVANEIVHACSLEGATEYINTKPWLSEECKDEAENKANRSSQNACELTVTIIHEQLARLRLIGPKSHMLLSATLELCDWRSEKESSGSRWWEVYSKGEERIKMLKEQNKSWENMNGVFSSGVLKSGSVIALVVKDPRLGLPVRKSSVDMSAEEFYKEESVEELMLTNIPTSSAVSPLWDTTVRQEVKQTKMPEKDLNNLRSKQPLPGSKIDLGDDASRIPMLVIQQPCTTADDQTGSINFGSGYDVIFPAGWSMAFWIAFVYRGARVGGTRELETCSREQGIPHFPRDFPDTRAGREYNEEQKRNGEEKYKRYPPAKRPNYKKLGMTCPFGPDWISLANEWSEKVKIVGVDVSDVVVSEVSLVQDSQCAELKCIETKNNEKKVGKESEKLPDDLGNYDDDDKLDTRRHCVTDEICDSAGNPSESQNTINKSNINSVGNGLTEDTSILHDNSPDSCEKTKAEILHVIRSFSARRRLQDIAFSLEQHTTKKRQKNYISQEEIMEYITKTITTHPRSLVCLNIQQLKGCPEDNAVIYIPSTEDLLKLKEDKRYEGPVEDNKYKRNSTLIDHCSRKAIGWITSGQFSFSRGQGSAIGFCPLPGFRELIIQSLQEKCRLVVLIRNTNTFQYRFANIKVV